MKKKILALVLALAMSLSLAACGSDDADEDASSDASASSSTGEEIVADESIPDEAAESDASAEAEAEAAAYEWDAGSLAYLEMSREELLAVYDAYDIALEENDYDEDASAEQVAAEYDLTAEDVTNIAVYGCAMNYFATFDVESVELRYADSVEVNTVGGVVNLKAYITASTSNEQTVDKNYYIACEFVRDYAGADFETINYSAYAPDTNGDYTKVVSFVLSGDIIATVADSTSSTFADNTLGDYVTDLYILGSLQS